MAIAAAGTFPISGFATSVFPTVGGVNPSLTIQGIACRTADRIRALAACGEL
jgi:choline dehydrogenase-like flavoprotein